MRIALVLAMLVILIGESFHSIRTTNALRSPATVQRSASGIAQTYCWAAEVRRTVPRGALVYAEGGTVASQRLAEAAALWASLVPSPHTAEWILSFRSSSSGCNGVKVVAERT